jgi:hypothetical protein
MNAREEEPKAAVDRPRSGTASAGRERLFGALAVALALVLCLLVAELALRFLPVHSGLWTLPVNASQPIYRFMPDREFLFSRDWNFSIVNRGRANNDGFVNQADYALADRSPLLAVVGDSYVEAAMVPNRETFYGRLADALGSRGRIYSFGASGAPLSQYLVWAQYAAEKYRPRGIVILVIGNDFDESLAAYSVKPGFHLYAKDSSGELRLALTEFSPSPWRSLLRQSALARYFVFNLHGFETLAHVGTFLVPPARADNAPYTGNTAADASPRRVDDSYQAIDAFFRDLPVMTKLAADRIAFLVDGARYERDVTGVEQSYFGLMRKRFIAEATRRGYEAIDLQPWFLAKGRVGATRFDFPTDGHWNAAGHAIAAEALASSALYRTTFGGR